MTEHRTSNIRIASTFQSQQNELLQLTKHVGQVWDCHMSSSDKKAANQQRVKIVEDKCQDIAHDVNNMGHDDRRSPSKPEIEAWQNLLF